MRTVWLFLFLLLAQDVSKLATAALPKGDLSALTPEQARKAAQDVQSSAEAEELVRSAIQSRRLDLLALYLVESPVSQLYDFNREVSRLPDSRFKVEVVILMLKSPMRFWPAESGTLPYGSRGVVLSLNDEPYKSVVSQVLRGGRAEGASVQDRSSRIELATRLEQALEEGGANNDAKAANEEPLKHTPTSIQIPQREGSAQNRISAASPPPPPPLTAKDNDATRVAFNRKVPVWLSGVVIVLLAAGVLVYWRRRVIGKSR